MDLDTGEISVAIVDVEESTVLVDGEEISGETELEENQFMARSVVTTRNFKTNFNVSVRSLAAAVAAIAGIAAIVSAVATAGLSIAAFKAGLTVALKTISGISGAAFFTGNVRISGSFTRDQQLNTSNGKARNLNRKVNFIVTRDGKRVDSGSHNYGNGSWFNTIRP